MCNYCHLLKVISKGEGQVALIHRWSAHLLFLIHKTGLEVIELESNLRIKIDRNDWLLADTCVQAANKADMCLQAANKAQ